MNDILHETGDGENFKRLLEQALTFRLSLLENLGEAPGIRLFNGFWEGLPGLVIELYDRTLVIQFHGSDLDQQEVPRLCQRFYQAALPRPIECVLVKNRISEGILERQGRVVFGGEPAQKVLENGIWYALDLRLNQDTSLYLDTRLLRQWAKENLSGARVLNTFAYTGSLGAAALASGARSVLQTDLSNDFLSLAQETYRLNGWRHRRTDFWAADFFSMAAQLKRRNALFDCIFLDPPFFSVTSKGRVDVVNEYIRLINKVRPLIAHTGRLVAVNNALYLPGQEYLDMLLEVTRSGYAEFETIIPAPPDFTGFLGQPALPLPADPAPFNYSTKIAILRFQRKDQRRE